MTDVVRLGKIVAVFAALRAKSAVDKSVVHKTIFALTITRASPRGFRRTHHRRRRRETTVVICLLGVRPVALASVAMISCSAVALTTMDYQFARPVVSVNVGNNSMQARLVSRVPKIERS